ncbi:MAG: hypothetical protein V5A68_06660 [Candidatus Thermoplasmatota archaeon]
MVNSKKIIVVISIIFAISVLIFAGCNSQTDQPQNNTEPDNSSNSTSMTGNVVATVNGENITSEEVEKYVQQKQGQISKAEGLRRLIDLKVIFQQAQKEGYVPSDAEAESKLEGLLKQQNLTLEDYKQQLEQQGRSYEQQLQKYKEQLARQNYIDDEIKKEEFNITDEQAKAELENMFENNASTLEDYKKLLEKEYQMSYEQFKRGLKEQLLIQDLRDKADISYKQ